MTTADPRDPEQLDALISQIARDAGAGAIPYPRPGRAVHRTVLRDVSNDRGTQTEIAQIEDDGTLRIIGHDRGPGVSEFFGENITSYEWVYVVPPERVTTLLGLLGGRADDDILAVLDTYYQRHDGRLSHILKHPDAGAQFSNWHS